MPSYSVALSSTKDYPFPIVSKISKEVAETAGREVINARIGVPDEEAPQSVKEKMASYLLQEGSTFSYPCDQYDARGIPEFIESVINHYNEKYGVDLKPENIAITGWTKPVLHNLPRICGEGYIHIPDPTYPVYPSATELAGNKVKLVPMSKESNWTPEFDFEGGDVAFYFCDPNNPTGSVADEKYYRELANKVKKNDVLGIFDKAYQEVVFDDNTKPVSMTQIPELMDNSIEVVSFSKSHNLVGVGLGYIVGGKEVIDKYLKLDSQCNQGVEWYKQKTATDILTDPKIKKEQQDYLKKTLKPRADLFSKGLNKLDLKNDGLVATPYPWSGVPEGYDDEDFVLNRLLREAHVAFMPGKYFGESGKGYFRPTIYMPKEKISEALDRIKEIRDW